MSNITIWYDDDADEILKKVDKALADHNLTLKDLTVDGMDYLEYSIEKIKE